MAAKRSELEERLDELEDRLEHKTKALGLAILILDFGFLFLASKVAEPEPWHPSVPPWFEQRVDELDRKIHAHLHPEEYTHHDR